MVAVSVSQVADSPQVRRQDWQIISLVGLVHAISHFFQLLLPTLFLPLAQQFGYDFAQLGLLVSAFFLVSCLGQASSGFIVDRIGAVPVLRFGLTCFVVAGVLIGSANGYGMLLAGAVLGGLGNSVFHPADYFILNQRVSHRRLGHAFSTHGLTGYLGWAFTPVFMATLIQLYNWRVAAYAAAGVLAMVLLLVIAGNRLLSQAQAVRQAPDAHDGPAGIHAPDLSRQSVGQTLATLLVQPALWGAFLFFAFVTASLSAIQNYTIPMLGNVYGIGKVLAGTALSSYMVSAAMGLLAGGFLVGVTPRTERTVFASLLLAALSLLVLASGVLPAWLAIVFVALTGFFSGVSAPSRDMLIRRIAPKGATGTVYGLVYSGMDVGSSMAPVVFGLMLDAGWSVAPWFGAAACFAVGSVLAVAVARFAVRQEQRPAVA
jgi:FSR family fosmidomycin resistance protein-like MFS transporter